MTEEPKRESAEPSIPPEAEQTAEAAVAPNTVAPNTKAAPRSSRKKSAPSRMTVPTLPWPQRWRAIARSVGIVTLRYLTQTGQTTLARLEAADQTPTDQARTAAVATTLGQWGQRLVLLLRQLGRLWRTWLLKLRQRLPAPWNDRLSDTALSGLVLAPVVLIWVVGSFLPTPTPAPKPATIVQVLPETIEKIPVQPWQPEPTPPPVSPVVTPSSTAIVPSAPLSPQPTPTTTPVDRPEEPIAPAAPLAPSPITSPEPTAPPAPLNPEQQFLAALQAEVQTLAATYDARLQISLQLDQNPSHTTIVINPAWYELPLSQQNQLANALWQWSQDKNFITLALRSHDGITLARSPVIGSAMVILRRRLPASLLPKDNPPTIEETGATAL